MLPSGFSHSEHEWMHHQHIYSCTRGREVFVNEEVLGMGDLLIILILIVLGLV